MIEVEVRGIIELPEDETRKRQLEEKLQEYYSRIHLYIAPESQMDAICKAAVLERLLRNGSVDIAALRQELEKKFGTGFQLLSFINACLVIQDYCLTGGKNTRGGTGLPKI